MTILLVTFSLAFLSIIFLLVKLKTQEIRTKKTERETIKIHKELNFPKINIQDQFKILEEYDLTPIINLSPKFEDRLVPNSIIKNYISVSKIDFKNHLISSAFLDKKIEEYKTYPDKDGFWWDGERIIDQERGTKHQYWNATSKEEAIDVYAKILWEKIELK